MDPFVLLGVILGVVILIPYFIISKGNISSKDTVTIFLSSIGFVAGIKLFILIFDGEIETSFVNSGFIIIGGISVMANCYRTIYELVIKKTKALLKKLP